MAHWRTGAGGADGAAWCIDYDDTISDDGNVGYRIDGHRYGAGYYASLRGAYVELSPACFVE